MRSLVLVAALASAATAGPTDQQLIDVITIQPRSNLAEPYAMLLLDRVNINGTLDELDGWVDRMLAMPRLLDGRPDLVHHLRTLHVRIRYQRARMAFGAARRANDADALRSACDAFLATAALSVTYSARITVSDGLRSTPIAEEATFNAGVCYLEAGDTAAGFRVLSAIADRELSAIAWRHMIVRVVRAPYAWLSD